MYIWFRFNTIGRPWKISTSIKARRSCFFLLKLFSILSKRMKSLNNQIKWNFGCLYENTFITDWVPSIMKFCWVFKAKGKALCSPLVRISWDTEWYKSYYFVHIIWCYENNIEMVNPNDSYLKYDILMWVDMRLFMAANGCSMRWTGVCTAVYSLVWLTKLNTLRGMDARGSTQK